jgi:ribonuclease BN (tRNA processing enzyme)
MESSMPSDLKVILLGTGTPRAEPDRSGPAVALASGDATYLVDCGPGVVRQVVRAARKGLGRLDAARLNRVFITHLHSDHTVGFPDLMLTPWVLGREEPLEVFGPPGVSKMAELARAAYRQDIDFRLSGLEPANRSGSQVLARDVQKGAVYRDGTLIVEAFPVDHGSWTALGYRFRTPGRTIVVSGDTAPVPAMVEMARGCDVLVHEVYSVTGLARQDPQWQRYHSKMHTSSKELARIASRARPRLLVLYHQLLWETSEEELLSEIKRNYDGEVVYGKDLELY